MRVVLSADMEAVAQISDVREVLACRPEYWETGRRYLTDDVVAAATGLLEGGASEVVVLDNHGSGNPWNVLLDELPAGVRGESWNVFDLAVHGIDGLLQVGYHPRAGVAGFVPHSYIPGLRLSVDGEEISESHGRIWAARTALVGIVGHAAHERTLGTLSDTPFLVVQDGEDPHRTTPLFADAGQGAEAIREFASRAMRGIADAPRPEPPADATFQAIIDDANDEQAARMQAAGWTRAADTRFIIQLSRWADARDPLAVAMGAAMAPFSDTFTALDLTSPQAFAQQDHERLNRLTSLFLDWTARMTVADDTPT